MKRDILAQTITITGVLLFLLAFTMMSVSWMAGYVGAIAVILILSGIFFLAYDTIKTIRKKHKT